MPGEVSSDSNNVKIEKAKKEFARKNGNNLKDFTNKEVMLMLHKESMKKHDELTKSFEKHDAEGKKNLTMGLKFIAEHDRIIAQITSVIPQKGFSEKVENALDMDKDVTTKDKVETLWNDRKLQKGAVILIIGVFGMEILRFFI